MDELRDFANMIRELREERGITQEELAEMAGISVSHLAKIEVHIRTASMWTYLKLLEALEVPKESQLSLLASKSEKRGLQQKLWHLLRDCDVKEMTILLHTLKSMKEIMREQNATKGKQGKPEGE